MQRIPIDKSKAELQLWNCTQSIQLASSIETADRRSSRNKGLLGRDQLAAGCGLWIVPCRAIHTIGMRFAIDVLYLGSDHRVRRICHSIPPWRLSGCILAHSVIELAAGTLASSRIEVNDLLALHPVEQSGSDNPHPQLMAR